MGVHGLWRLLDSFGTVIQPDELKGKRVAIDASIWIAQFRARIAPGEDIEHKILEGFLARILKLLFYGIKPVFVFDGQASATKGAEHYRRMRQRAANEQAQLKRRAKQILMAQVAAGSIDIDELKKAIQADAENAKSSRAAAGEESSSLTSAQVSASAAKALKALHRTAPEGSASLNQEEAEKLLTAEGHSTSLHGKRRREEAQLSTKPRSKDARHRLRHQRRRRRLRRLAPDAVASRSTLHFLQDVEGMLEERSKLEARVLHNALHNTSTSLFMGPRRAVDDENPNYNTHNNTYNGAGGRLSDSTAPPPVFVVEDNGALHASAETAGAAAQAESAISVTDSDTTVDDGGDADGDDDSKSSSDCCAVSSRGRSRSSDVSVVSSSDVVMVEVEKRNASSRSPSGARGRSNGGVTLLHSGDLSRFLTTLSQLTPPVLTPPQTDRQEGEEGEASVEGKTNTHEAGASLAEEEVRAEADALGGAEGVLRRSPQPSRPVAYPDIAATKADAPAETEVVSISNSRSSCASGDEEDEQADTTTSDEESADSNAQEEEEDSESSAWEDEEDEDSNSDSDEEEEPQDPTYAADLTWEPFTQRIDTDVLLRQLASARSKSQEASAATPPRSAVQPDHAADDDDEFTPVKLGRPSLPHSPPAGVVVVHSSDDEEGNSNIGTSNSAVHVSSILQNTPNADGGRASDGVGPDSRTSNGSSILTKTTSETVAKSTAAPPAEASARSSTAARLNKNASRSNVAIVPFELLRIVELLDCCGVPYVLSPAEADAQCAFLARSGLVDAVFTEDSDVLVHGATTVLRGFFAQSKNVVAYRQAELAACGITKTVLVALASLLGCDYTDGVSGIGLVGALEALVVAWTPFENAEANADSPLAVLHVLRRWAALVRRPPQSWHDVDDVMTVAQFALLHAALTQWHLLEQKASFPETQAVEAFYAAEVDADVTPFTWLAPDWHQLRVFAGALGALSSPWLVQRFELARKEWVKREEEAAKAGVVGDGGQRRLTEYGARERVRAEWAYQKQPRRHAAVLSQLRAVQLVV